MILAFFTLSTAFILHQRRFAENFVNLSLQKRCSVGRRNNAAGIRTAAAALEQIPPQDRFVACDRYTPYCMNGRNLWMVEHATRLIAVFDGSPGGTANTVRHAAEHGLSIVRLNPATGERW